MHALVATAAVAVILLSASDAEARARFKFGSGAKVAPKATAAPPSGAGGGVVVPAALIGGSIAARSARSRDDLPTGSMTPVGAMPSGTVSSVTPTSAKPAAKPAFVCGGDKSVGAGIGFCQVN